MHYYQEYHLHTCTCPLLYTPTCICTLGNQYIPIPAPEMWGILSSINMYSLEYSINTFLHRQCTCMCLCNTIPCTGHWLGPNWEACVWAGLQPSLLGRTTLLFPDRQQVGLQYMICSECTCERWKKRNMIMRERGRDLTRETEKDLMIQRKRESM